MLFYRRQVWSQRTWVKITALVRWPQKGYLTLLNLFLTCSCGCFGLLDLFHLCVNVQVCVHKTHAHAHAHTHTHTFTQKTTQRTCWGILRRAGSSFNALEEEFPPPQIWASQCLQLEEEPCRGRGRREAPLAASQSIIQAVLFSTLTADASAQHPRK